VAQQGDETGDGRGELLRRYGGRAEERELGAARAVGDGAEGEADDGGAGRAALEVEAEERQQRLYVARRSGEIDASGVEAFRLERERQLDPFRGEALPLHP